MVDEDVIILNFAQDNIFFGTRNSAGGSIVVSLTCAGYLCLAFSLYNSI
jgi:hypothetical protein